MLHKSRRRRRRPLRRYLIPNTNTMTIIEVRITQLFFTFFIGSIAFTFIALI